ncbi:MAG: TIGR03905 family TSCPD domain-containing protein [Lachnospiraceae bacterium]|jgi:uncharacterized protein (TIGR03905 family)
MKYSYKTHGTCSEMILIDVDDASDTINSVQFIGGCNGNTKGISALVKGMKTDEVIGKLGGIRCGFRPTSCPDQLATALKQMKNAKG